jgi:hypothetical protein
MSELELKSKTNTLPRVAQFSKSVVEAFVRFVELMLVDTFACTDFVGRSAVCVQLSASALRELASVATV